MSKAHPWPRVPFSGTYENIAVSRSNDGGRTWQAPADPIGFCDPPPNPYRFLNDCYFIGDCAASPPPTDPSCTALAPAHGDCGSYPQLIDVSNWESTDEEVCTGGHANSPGGANGTLYLSAISYDEENPGWRDLLLCRSSDRGASFDIFPSNLRRIKHVCITGNTDRPAIAASPVSDDVFVFSMFPAAYAGIACWHSSNRGDMFSTSEILDARVIGTEYMYAPAGATNAAGDLFVVWHWRENNNCEAPPGEPPPARLRFRWWRSGAWEPALANPPYTVRNAQGVPITFTSWTLPGTPDGFTEYSAPSVVIDQTLIYDPLGMTAQPGPNYGRIYVVYAERHSCETPWRGRVKIISSCDGGVSWTEPQTISEPITSLADSVQVYPRVRIDGRGTVFVSWYDTRFRERDAQGATLPGQPFFDVYTAYFDTVSQTWKDQRLSGAGLDPSFFRFNGESRDYSGMAADPTPGTSNICVLAMGRASDQARVGVHSFKVLVRGLGDYDGDFDVDCHDASFNTCIGNAPACECRLLDMDQDGDVDIHDLALFDLKVGASQPMCHGPCQAETTCAGGMFALGEGGMTSGAPEESAPPRPLLRGCELAMSFMSYAPPDSAAALVDRLETWIRHECDDSALAAETHEFIECLRAALE